MKNSAQVIKTEKFKATEFAMETTILTLNSIPTTLEQDQLFGDDDSIVLVF